MLGQSLARAAGSRPRSRPRPASHGRAGGSSRRPSPRSAARRPRPRWPSPRWPAPAARCTSARATRVSRGQAQVIGARSAAPSAVPGHGEGLLVAPRARRRSGRAARSRRCACARCCMTGPASMRSRARPRGPSVGPGGAARARSPPLWPASRGLLGRPQDGAAPGGSPLRPARVVARERLHESRSSSTAASARSRCRSLV